MGLWVGVLSRSWRPSSALEATDTDSMTKVPAVQTLSNGLVVKRQAILHSLMISVQILKA